MCLRLDQLKFYCDGWQLTINANFTIFGEKFKNINCDFKFGKRGLELVDEFKCLEAVPKSNGRRVVYVIRHSKQCLYYCLKCYLVKSRTYVYL